MDAEKVVKGTLQFSFMQKILHSLLAVILVASFAIPALAQEHNTDIVIENNQPTKPEPGTLTGRGRDYETVYIGDGIYRAIIGGVPLWTWNNSTQEWVPNAWKSDSISHIQTVQSGMIGWKIKSNEAEIYDSNMTNLIATERWIPRIGDIILEKSFQDQSTIHNNTGVYVTNTYSIIHQSTTATLKIVYAVHDGKPTERIVLLEGLPSTLASEVAIDREWTGLKASQLFTDDHVADKMIEDSVTETTKMRLSDGKQTYVRLIDNDGKLILHENLLTAGNKFDRIKYNDSLVVFTYDGWTASDSQLILKDDTFTSGAPETIQDGHVAGSSSTGTTCTTASFSRDSAATTMTIRVQDSSVNSTCRRVYVEIDITEIPDFSEITDVTISWEVSGTTNGRNCDLMPVLSQPSAITDSALWTDIGDGTAYVDNSNTCATNGLRGPIDLGTTADSDLESKLASNYFAIGWKADNEVRDSSLHQTTIPTEESVGEHIQLDVTYTPPSTVTVPITINPRSGSDTMEIAGVVATVTCTGGGGSHDGNSATQNFACNPSTTVLITLPTDASTSRFRFSDGTTSKSFLACGSGTCSPTVYSDVTRQMKLTITASGLDANKSIAITRIHVGSTGTDNIPGSTASGVWADQRTNVMTPDNVILISDQERFKSYNSTSQRTMNMSAAASQTYMFQHEFNQLFRIHENNIGETLAGQPTAIFSGTITTANGTELALTFSTTTTLEYVSTASRYWIKNGTTSWGEIEWFPMPGVRAIVVDADTDSVLGYGFVDAESRSKTLGYADGSKYIRIALEGPIDENSIELDTASATLSLEGMSSSNTVIEWLQIDYSDVRTVEIVSQGFGPTQSFQTLLPNNNIGYLIIADEGYDSEVIVVFSTRSGAGLPLVGKGGGSGGGMTVPPIVIPNPGTSGGTPLGLWVDVPQYYVAPGSNQTQMITISWSGRSRMVITSITFQENAQWFVLAEDVRLPVVASLQAGHNHTLQTQIPLNVAVPVGESGMSREIEMRVTAIGTGGTESTAVLPVKINYTGSPIPGGIALILLVTAAVAGSVVAAIRRSRR